MMPWEKPPVQPDDLTIPAFLKRDANNTAPYMLKTSSQINPASSPQLKDLIALQLWGSTTSSRS